MADEIPMILRMLADGKITAEQAEALIKALPTDSSRPGRAADPAAGTGDFFAGVQTKLSDLQGKLSELQVKIAASQAGLFDRVKAQVCEVELRPAIDETARVLSSVKQEVVRGARIASRFAARQARRIGAEALSAGSRIADEFCMDMSAHSRPRNTADLPESSDTVTVCAPAATGAHVSIVNPFGNVRVTQGSEPTVTLKAVKTAWGSIEEDRARRLSELRIAPPDNSTPGYIRFFTAGSPHAIGDAVADFDVVAPAGVVLSIETGFGDIDVEGFTGTLELLESGTGDVRVKGVKHDDDREEANLRSRYGSVFVEDYEGGPLSCGQTWSVFLPAPENQRGRGRLELVGVKSRSNVTARTNAGPVRLIRVETPWSVNVSTVSGDVEIEKVDCGSATISTTSGDITAHEVDTTVDKLALSSVSGDIRAEKILSDAVTIGTVSGDANLACAEPVIRSVGATTVSGDIKVTLADQCGAMFELKSQSGDLSCSRQFEPHSESGTVRVLAGVVGDGKGSVKLQSVSGNLEIA